MKFEIEKIETGWLLILPGNEKYAYDDFVNILRYLNEFYNLSSRHDAERIYIIKAPGDKHPDFTEEHGKVIWGNDESN